jgi:predicted nuclease with TOPRIM domain
LVLTFLGITYGLIHFDTSPDLIKDSIKELLDGLKTAFYTSITGIICSLISGIFVKYQLSVGSIVDKVEATELRLFLEMNKSLLSIKHSSEKRTSEIKTVISTQVKHLTSKFDSLNTNFEEFFDTMADKNAEAIQDALKEVLEDFNDVFTEFIAQLVNKNFDKLTLAIDQLIKWQIEYKSDIEKIKESYESLVEKHQEFVANTSDWVKNLEEIAGKSSQLKKIVEEFKAAFDDDSNFSEVVHKITSSVDNLLATSTQIKSISEVINRTATSFSNTEENITNWLEKEDSVKDQVHGLSHAIKELRKFDIVQIENLEQHFAERLENTFKGLDDLLSEQLKYIISKEKAN